MEFSHGTAFSFFLRPERLFGKKRRSWKEAATSQKECQLSLNVAFSLKKSPNALFFQKHFYLCLRSAREIAFFGVLFCSS
jgi:hypothetical protein